jgi:hypothetical protein
MANTGNQGWTILEGYYVDDNSLDGFIMPNIINISNSAIVPSSATITYNQTNDVVPTGGSNGDIWYNQPSDLLYKKVAGVWSLLTDRAINAYYQAPIQNLTACPI